MPLKIGMNLSAGACAHDTTSLQFADLMRVASGWYWDKGEPADVPAFAASGYPAFLEDQTHTLTCVAALNGTLPLGTYQVSAQGVGKIMLSGPNDQGWIGFTFDASGKAQPLEVTRAGGLGSQWTIVLLASDRKDPLRELKILLPGHGPDDVWNRDFTGLMAPFAAFRFMDWSATNGSPLVTWDDREKKKIPDFFQSRGRYEEELSIRLCNDLKRDCWLNLPHQANDDFIVRLAKLVDSTLDPSLTIYVEYSNETWNYGFPQYAWIAAQDKQAASNPEWWYAGQLSAQSVNTFAKALGPGRKVVRVLAGQRGYLRVTQAKVEGAGQVGLGTDFDALAVDGYFQSSTDWGAALALFQKDPAAGIAATLAGYSAGLDETLKLLRINADYARSLGKGLLLYECGQFVTNDGNDPLTPLLAAANRDRGMGALYRQYLDGIAAIPEIQLACFYYDAGYWSKWGYWGHREGTYQGGAKWDAVASAAPVYAPAVPVPVPVPDPKPPEPTPVPTPTPVPPDPQPAPEPNPVPRPPDPHPTPGPKPAPDPKPPAPAPAPTPDPAAALQALAAQVTAVHSDLAALTRRVGATEAGDRARAMARLQPLASALRAARPELAAVLPDTLPAVDGLLAALGGK